MATQNSETTTPQRPGAFADEAAMPVIFRFVRTLVGMAALMFSVLLYAVSCLVQAREGALLYDLALPMATMLVALSLVLFAIRMRSSWFSNFNYLRIVTGIGIVIAALADLLGAPSFVGAVGCGVGCATLLALWMCTLTMFNNLLVTAMAALAIVIGGVPSALLLGTVDSPTLLSVCSCLAAVVSLCATVFVRGNYFPNIENSPEDGGRSRMLRSSTYHSVYGAMGLQAGFVFFLVFGLCGTGRVDLGALGLGLLVVFAVAAVLLLCLSRIARFSYSSVVREYNAFFMTLGLLPLCLAGYIGLERVVDISLVYLMCFTALQAALSLNSVPEWSMVDHLSPLWYCTELIALFGAALVGVAVAWVGCMFDIVGLSASCFAVLAAVTFLQTPVDKGFYPEKQEIEDAYEKIRMEQHGASDDLLDRRVELVSDEFGLTARERQVLGYLAKGRNTEHIAKALYVAKSTAKTHVLNVYRKLDVHSQQDLMDMIENFR